MADETTTTPLIRTKLQRPPIVGDHVHRPRLLERLDQRRQRPLTLVTAPAGYGKSTLVSCWLESCDLPTAWLSLDETENDLHLFLSYFLAAVQTVSPGAGKEIQTILNAPQLPPLSTLAGILINELDQIEQTFILTLDDYHVIQKKVIHDLLVEILKHPPQAMHLVLVSRVDPPLPLASLRAKGEMTEIRVQDLRFSLAETTEYLQKIMGKTIEDSIVALLGKKTEGWVTGLRLAALSLRHRKDLNRVLTDLPNGNRYVMDYMVAEVLSQQPPDIQEYLLSTSILNRLCAPLCDAVCVSGSASGKCEAHGREFIDWIEQTNLFVIPLDDERRWFRYHHLFQDLLKSLLKRKLSPEDIDALHRSAGTWFADKGLIEEALHHFLAGGDNRAAAQLIVRNRHDIMNQEQWHRLERWLSMLPSDSIERIPDLLLTKVWISENRVRLSEMMDIFNKIEALLAGASSETVKDWEALTAEFNVQKAYIQYVKGDSQGVVYHAKLALGKLAPNALSAQGVCQTMLAVGYQMMGQLDKAYSAVHNALKEQVASGTTYYSWLFNALCFIHWIAADLKGLRQGAVQLLNLSQKFNLPQSIAMGHYFSGIAHYLLNELPEAEAQLRLAVQDRYKADTVNYSHSTFALTLCLQAQIRPEDAAEIVEDLIGYALESHNGELLSISQAFQAELTLRQGNIPKAEQWAQNYDPHPFNPGHRFYLPQLTLVKVHLALNTKQSQQQAHNLLSQLHDYYSSIHNTRFRIDILALQALIHDARSDEAAAFEKVVEALNLAEPDKIIRPFLDLGSKMADLLNRLTKQDVSLKFIGILLKAFRNEMSCAARSDLSVPAPIEQPSPETGPLDSLSKRELEIMTLLAQRMSNKEIGENLFLSISTIKTHLYNIYQKLNAKNRRQAVEKARSLGIVQGCDL
jgi:LuxR family maltose regulon positive regulatory protein